MTFHQDRYERNNDLVGPFPVPGRGIPWRKVASWIGNVLAGAKGDNKAFGQPDLRPAFPPPKAAAGLPKAEIPIVKALLPAMGRQIGPIPRRQMQKNRAATSAAAQSSRA